MKKALITGTDKGKGLETALAFGRAGYMVFATMRNPDGAPALACRAAEESLELCTR
jgi:NAD(P)-dependent dehydrogenase (short-subunit alcohol dehydrogenase family)